MIYLKDRSLNKFDMKW